MPINILRLNHAPSSHPNAHIAFVKPLPRPPTLQAEHVHASTFLYAIAAQCLPVMKSHHLSVTTLEEHEWNREFIGRNFNNGEIIQLVLRRRDGSWMSFNQVQMVMMHELAHNVQMNHSKAFWAERNKFAAQLKNLWSRGYTGDGFWGTGKPLEGLESHQNNTTTIGIDGEVRDMCGGTFRNRGRKRKRQGATKDARNDHKTSTWRERRDKRVERRFGKNGVALGEDEDARIQLEICKKGAIGGKPRVAGSKRGKELRAAAALKRLDVQKLGSALEPDMERDGNVSVTEDDTSSGEELNEQTMASDVDTEGRRISNTEDSGMINVCGGEAIDAADLRQEAEDFNFVQMSQTARKDSKEAISSLDRAIHSPKPDDYPLNSSADRPDNLTSTRPANQTDVAPTTLTCPICTSSNDSLSPTCTTCSHVLDRRKDPRAWKCVNQTCIGSEYWNAGDCGRCGGCGGKKGDEG